MLPHISAKYLYKIQTHNNNKKNHIETFQSNLKFQGL